MNHEQIELVKSTFSLVEPISDTAAKLFYGRLFEIAPTVEALFQHTDMHVQRHSLMATLGLVVQNLDRTDVVVPAAEKLGMRHARYGVQPQHYPIVGEALLWTLAQGLGDAFTDDVKEAWTEAYSLLSTVMQSNLAAA